MKKLDFKKSAEFFEIFIENSYDWEMFVNAEGKIEYISPSCEKISGYSAKEFIDNPNLIKEITYADDKEIIDEHYEKKENKTEEAISLDYRIICKNGDVKWIEHNCRKAYYKNKVFLGYRSSNTDISERKEFEEILRIKNEEIEKDEKLFRAVFENSSIGKSITYIDGSLIANNSFAKMLGYNLNELETINWPEITHREDVDKSSKVVEILLKGEKSTVEFEKRYIHKNGSIIYADVRTTLQKDDNENPLFFITTIMDITQRKKDEILLKQLNEEYESINEELRQSNDQITSALEKSREDEKIISEKEKRFRKMFENMKSGVAIYKALDDNSDFVFVDFNRAAEKITNAKKEKIVGKTLLSKFPNMGKTPLYDALKKVNKTGEDVSLPAFYYKDSKREGWRENYIYKLPSGEIVAIFDDVTENKNAEIKLQNQNIELIKAKEKAEENELKFRGLYEYSSVGTAIISLDFKILDSNDAYCNMLGYSRDEILGKSLQDITRPEILEKNLELQSKLGRDEIPSYQLEKSFIHKDGHTVYGLLNATLIKNINNEPLYFLGNVQDITYKKIVEQELIIAKEKAEESDRLKTAFLQNMSHEIRTPLNAICGFSGLLDSENISDEKRSSFVSIIQNSSSQLLSIVSDILTISSIETKQAKLHLENVCINDLIIELLSVFKPQAKNQNISLYAKQQLNDNQSLIKTDKTKITQILNNLITNALKFTHQGSVEFGYNLVEKDGHETLQFYVKDTGIGIASDQHKKIFERFRQADLSTSKNYGGTGLGLSISKGFVDLLGGKIWVESEPQKGATFYFTIPYNPVKQENNTRFNEKNGTKKIKTILVAEDEEFNFLFIEEVLIAYNFKIIHAKDGQETVDICKSNSNIDLILMDIKMPVLDGHSATKIIKKFLPNLPIIAQSAYALKQEIEKYSGIFDDYITKPINKEELVQKVTKYVEKV